MYTLIDAEALPFSVLEETFEGRWAMDGSYPVSPKLVLEHDARGRKVNDGALGSVMVFSVELQEDEEKTVEEAVRTVGPNSLSACPCQWPAHLRYRQWYP